MQSRDGLKYKCIGVTAVLLLVLLILSGREANGEETGYYSVVALGDSVLGEYREDGSITAQLSLQLGQPVFNGALGGTRMARRDRDRLLGENEDGLSMAALSKSIVTEDFGVQQTIHVKTVAAEYFDDTIDEMDRLDYDRVEILLIQHCLNDYQDGIPIENPEDPYDEYTYNGALRSTLRSLQKEYPDLRIVLLTPTYTWYIAQGLTCEEFDTGGGILEDYVEAQMQVAEEMEVEIIDLYHDFYPHETWEDWQIYSRDGVHPNEAGRSLIAHTLAEYFLEYSQKEMTP